MCGICGMVNLYQEHLVEYSDLKRMCDVMIHRGPDDEGIKLDGNVGIGMRRLSIIDLVTGHQPIANEDGSIWIVCNGEIYNYIALRDDLEKKGHIFRTRSDVESILHAYEEYGEECCQKLNGMFAFIIWDSNKNLFLLVRDRIGIKPLYYYLDKNRFVCASELKSILQVDNIQKRVDFQAIDNFLTLEYIPAPLTIFKDIHKLLPGHSLTFRNGNIEIKRYWDITYQDHELSEYETKQNIRELLQDSVKIRLMSDVPLGVFLSGGTDSSIIVALMAQVMDQPVKTFSIGFEDSTYNELNYARIIAKQFNTEHHEFIIKPDAVNLTENLIGFLDEPLGDFSIFPTYLVSKMAREYVKVVLSGDGGDELFAGYDTYIADKVATYYDRLPGFIKNRLIKKVFDSIPPSSKKKGFINRSKRFIEGTRLPKNLRHARWMSFLQPEEKNLLYADIMKRNLVNEDPYKFIYHYFNEAAFNNSHDGLNQQLYVDLKTYLVDDILVKVDRMSMATSLETRVPFLDYRFIEFISSIPGDLKLKGIKTKWILKQSMVDILPKEILFRGKEGFSIPIKNWLQNELKPMMMDVLSPDRIKREGYFNFEYIERLKNEHLKGIENHSHRIWALMMFEMWQDKFLHN